MRIRLSLAVLWTIMILIMCWTPADWLPVQENQGSGWAIPDLDKIVHAGLFVGFAVLWMEALDGRPRRITRVVAAGLAVAVISELGQLIPVIKRDGEIADVVADCAGLFLGLLLYRMLDGLRQQWMGRRVAAETR